MIKYIFCGVIVFLLPFSGILAQENAFPLQGSLWHSNTISVCWDNPSEDNKVMREVVRQAITDTWQKHSALKFTDWCDAAEKDADIHIFINDEGPHTKGLGTNIKNLPKGMVLNFTFNQWSKSCRFDKEFCIKAIAVHEFGHALGFAHEQNRKDCKFKDCLGKEQGTVGDWYLTSCDPNSVMNYCNPRWSNNGILSDLDIQAVQYLYGRPDNAIVEFNGLSSVQNAEFSGVSGALRRYNFRIYIIGSKELLDKIRSVKYNLDDAEGTFKKPEMTGGDRYNNFGIGLLKVWGEFDIKITVYYKDGSTAGLIHHLTIDEPGVVNKKRLKQKGG